MEHHADIFYSDTFTRLTDLLIAHLAQHMDENTAIDKVLLTIDHFEKRIASNPLSCHVSPHLAEFGVLAFREFIDQDYRILYRVIETTSQRSVYADAILSQKQDIAKVINDYSLRYPDVNLNHLV